MNKLIKKEFCIIGVEQILGLKDDVISMSTGIHRIIDANNMLVMTFKTFLSPSEMKIIIEETEGRTYFLFELNPKSSSVKIKREDVNNYLFSTMIENTPLDIISTKFGTMGINNLDNNEKLHSRVTNTEGKINEILDIIRNRNHNNYSEDELSSYTKEEQNTLLDQLLDKAPNLTEDDKRILDFLVNKKN